MAYRAPSSAIGGGWAQPQPPGPSGLGPGTSAGMASPPRRYSGVGPAAATSLGFDANQRAALAAQARAESAAYDPYGSGGISAALAAERRVSAPNSARMGQAAGPTPDVAASVVGSTYELLHRVQVAEAERDEARQELAGMREQAGYWKGQAEKAWTLIERLRQMPFAFAETFGREVEVGMRGTPGRQALAADLEYSSLPEQRQVQIAAGAAAGGGQGQGQLFAKGQGQPPQPLYR